MPNLNKLSKYLKAEGCKDGDVITFLDAGEIKTREFEQNGKKEEKDIFEIKVEFKGDEKLYSPNATSRKLLSKSFGVETEKWVSKKARITILPSSTGHDMIVAKPIVADDKVNI
jgi:hypothetical protein